MGSTSKSVCLVMLFISLLAGCASGVKRADDPQKRSDYFSRGGKLSPDVSLTLSKDASAQLAENVKFNTDELLAHIKKVMGARQMLGESSEEELPTIQITITDIRVRSNFSAVMWGALAGNDHIVGDVIAQDNTGRQLQKFEVSASYALGGIRGGQEDTRMGWLYETFSEELVNALTGTPNN